MIAGRAGVTSEHSDFAPLALTMPQIRRRELLLQGQYGIGLLGFWSIGTELELRSQVAGGEP